jgi:hypothetical protein
MAIDVADLRRRYGACQAVSHDLTGLLARDRVADSKALWAAFPELLDEVDRLRKIVAALNDRKGYTVDDSPEARAAIQICPVCRGVEPHPLESLCDRHYAELKPPTKEEMDAALEQGRKDREAVERDTPMMPGRFR